MIRQKRGNIGDRILFSCEFNNLEIFELLLEKETTLRGLGWRGVWYLSRAATNWLQ
jgi:hypothetical protein